MEVEGRTVRFCDLAYFMDNEATVAKEDCTFLQFLWWPEGNLEENREEYQMAVHFWGHLPRQHVPTLPCTRW